MTSMLIWSLLGSAWRENQILRYFGNGSNTSMPKWSSKKEPTSMLESQHFLYKAFTVIFPKLKTLYNIFY